MEWIQATSRPCYHHRFPIRLVRRPSPSGTPTSLEQTSQPRTTLMNWRCGHRGRHFLQLDTLYVDLYRYVKMSVKKQLTRPKPRKRSESPSELANRLIKWR